ncbi:twin transmembrane helix small protein [Rhodobaculum claviforme]|uniref:Twin transmembrane helix small protein n=1 Tax=Rhodobaculum claviforme TaxID=1549854 RepID=A0A934TJ06_9RHOB|nr:twin transmembrane helix small protein [Rhodobaculum claviforme]MBK5926974.1 twin transmembrane helix small protein [Rhodobaculum claviforme]
MLSDPLFILAALAVLAVAGVLAIGIGGFARGGAFNARNGNRMMRWRLGLQAVAVVLIVAFVVLRGQG